jgi:hypothetical protein
MQSYKGAQEPGALVTTPKPKSGTKPPTSTTTAGDGGYQGTKSPHPCFFYQTGDCKLSAEECRYQHVKISKAEFEALKKKRVDLKTKQQDTSANASPKGRGLLRRGLKARRSQRSAIRGRIPVLALTRQSASGSILLRLRE